MTCAGQQGQLCRFQVSEDRGRMTEVREQKSEDGRKIVVICYSLLGIDFRRHKKTTGTSLNSHPVYRLFP